jgi:3-oxoacyl-[acyl-carrier protein] reductase
LRIDIVKEGFGHPSSEADVYAEVKAGAELFRILTSRRSIGPPLRSKARATGRRCNPDRGGLPACEQAAAPATEATMDLGLKGKSALVTGGSKGIGLAIAELFAAEGANVAICARKADEVGNVVKSLSAKGVKSWGRAVDVADPDALKGWIDSTAAELGGIDTIVCNVSALAVGDTPETWEKSFRTDMMHTVNSVAAAMPYLEKSRSASISIISSVSGFEIDFAAGSYGAFKGALIHYAKGLSNQLIGKGIRVNAVSPGNTYFEGGIWNSIEKGNPDLFKTAMSLNPTGRMGRAEEVAYGVVMLASPLASRISGTNLIIDGALTKAV